MALPVTKPTSNSSVSVLPATGTVSNVASSLPYGIYANSSAFLSGAADMVAHVYQRLGGSVLDIEIKEENVYAAYEEACLEYSYIFNSHQAKNVLSSILGMPTASFDQDGQIISGTQGVNLKYPRFTFESSKRVGDGVSTQFGLGGTTPIYSASFRLINDVQDYDLQSIVSSAAASGIDASGKPASYAGINGDERIIIHRVYYKTPRASWRFFGYYGGLNVVGNLSNYGQFTDDSTFEMIPAWQNKLQAYAYEDNLYTRLSHYSFEIKDNKLRIFPPPEGALIEYMWFEFSLAQKAYDTNPSGSSSSGEDPTRGVNNAGTLPFDNVPYQYINAIGKQWIRKYALALCMETLGLVRSKINTIPIPGESVTLNGPELISRATELKDKAREELINWFDNLSYNKLTEMDAEISENAGKVLNQVPMFIFVG